MLSWARSPSTRDHAALVELTAAEIEKTGAHAHKPGGSELIRLAYALRHAYRAVPPGFLHVPGGTRAVPVH